MSEETTNQGRLDAQAYKADPANQDSPTSLHHKYEKGVRAELLIIQQQITDDLANTVTPLLPSADQKAAMDSANAPTAGNPFATMLDLSNQAAASQAAYDWRTDTGNPADGETKMNNADPTLATIVRVANIGKNGLNQSNLLLLLGDSDVLVLADNNEADKVYNFDIIGDPTQVGGSGSGGYVEIPVAFFAQGGGGLIADQEVINVLMRYDGSNTKFLAKSNNLSDLPSVSAARTNLNVYSTTEVYTKTETDNAFLKVTQNLADLDNAATARTNLNVYSTSEVYPIADVYNKTEVYTKTESNNLFLAKANNLSDLTNATTARANLGLGNSATLNVGTTAGTVAAGDDPRFGGTVERETILTINPYDSGLVGVGGSFGTVINVSITNADSVDSRVEMSFSGFWQSGQYCELELSSAYGSTDFRIALRSAYGNASGINTLTAGPQQWRVERSAGDLLIQTLSTGAAVNTNIAGFVRVYRNL